MLTQMDVDRLAYMKVLYMDWVNRGGEEGDPLIEKVADLLVEADDPQALWEAHIEWGENLTGVPCPKGCRDITQTVRIKNRDRLN